MLPIALLLIGSVGQSWTNTLLPTGFTWHWFADLAGNRSFTRAFGVSLTVALACCALNAAVGLPLAYALHHRAQAGRGMATRLVMLMPVAVPALTLGFGYIAIFSGDTLPWLGTLPLMIAAHAVLTLPYLLQTLLSDLRHLGPRASRLARRRSVRRRCASSSRSCCRTCGTACSRKP